MKYKIKISYETGNSFGRNTAEDYFELEWENLDIAKQNLQFIKEHYEMYKELESYRNKKSKEEIFSENKDKEWFVYKDGDPYFSQYCMKFKTDLGTYTQTSCFWCGYFETLYAASIEGVDNDLEFIV